MDNGMSYALVVLPYTPAMDNGMSYALVVLPYTLHDCISYIMFKMIEYSIDIVSGVIMILYPAI